MLREFFVENHLNMMETGFPIRIYHQDALGGTLQVLNHELDSHAASNVLLQSASFHLYMFRGVFRPVQEVPYEPALVDV